MQGIALLASQIKTSSRNQSMREKTPLRELSSRIHIPLDFTPSMSSAHPSPQMVSPVIFDISYQENIPIPHNFSNRDSFKRTVGAKKVSAPIFANKKLQRITAVTLLSVILKTKIQSGLYSGICALRRRSKPKIMHVVASDLVEISQQHSKIADELSKLESMIESHLREC